MVLSYLFSPTAVHSVHCGPVCFVCCCEMLSLFTSLFPMFCVYSVVYLYRTVASLFVFSRFPPMVSRGYSTCFGVSILAGAAVLVVCMRCV